jgi:hypothetical protein
MDSAPSPWPRLADAWWVYLLGAIELVLFPIGLVARVRCSVGHCADSWLEAAVDLDAISGLPRLLITGLFVGVAVLGWRAARRLGGTERIWWTAIAAVGVLLALAKLVSVHSTTKHVSPLLTLAVGVALAAAALGGLAATGRRWGIAGARPVVVALAAYAAAALGLDAIGSAVLALHPSALLLAAGSTFVEELGEAVTALIVVVAVRWNLPPGSLGGVPGSGVVQNPGSGQNAPVAGGQGFRQQ